ncbi:MAG: cell division protein PerM [Nocardioides sp.]
MAAVGGLIAAGSTLLVFCAVGVIGWFVTDAGVHGAPRDGLRIGALCWLIGHGSGVHVRGVAITVVPWGLTAVCGWVTWRMGYRVGDSVSGHGPDAQGVLRGERDRTVPIAAGSFVATYLAVTALVGTLVADSTTSPAMPRALVGAAVLALIAGAPGIAVGSGRAAIWAARCPELIRIVLGGCRRIIIAYLLVSSLVLIAAVAVDLSTAATIVSRLRADNGDTTLFVLATTLIVPNAVAFSGSYLLGPGFAIGTATVVSPSLVVVGPLPLLPLMAALPDTDQGGWVARGMILIPVLVATWAVLKSRRRYPTQSWFDGIVRGGASGVLAGLVFAAIAGLSGGAIGPGRMREVSPLVFDVLTHGIAYFGLGGLVGGALLTWWCRHAPQAFADRVSLGSSVGVLVARYTARRAG